MGATLSGNTNRAELKSTGSSRSKKRTLDADSDGSRPKKRRRSSKGIISIGLSAAWDVFSEGMASFFARTFLFTAEIIAKGSQRAELAEETDFINGLLHTLDYFQGKDMEILRRGWRLLCACSDAEKHVPLADASSAESSYESDVGAVLKAMQLHPTTIRIQLLGFRALRTIVVESGEQWEKLANAGAIPVFVSAMKLFSNDVIVQGLATTFLAVIVREVGDVPRSQLVALGGVQLVLEAMHNFNDDARFLHTACYALHQFGFYQTPADIFLANGGINMLLRLLSRHIDDSALVDLCLSALSKLSYEDHLMGRGVVPLLLKTMQRWPDEASIQGHNIVVLLHAIGREEIPPAVTIELIVKAMKAFEDSASLQFFACAALRELLHLVATDEVREHICSVGAVECVVTAVQKHLGVSGLQPMALLVLAHLWEQRQPSQEAAIDAFGGSDQVIALVTAMRVEVVDPNAGVLAMRD